MPPPNAGEQPAPRPQSPLRGMMPQSPLRIKQGGKFYERLLTKESSAANPSFRYYWAEPGSVPFVWETQPGTPRDDASRMHPGCALPAITPPPSYLLDRHCAGPGGAKVKAAAASRDRAKAKSGGTNNKAKGGKKRYRFKRVKIGGFVADMFRRLAVGKAWWRPAVLSPVQVSSSSRWLVATDKQAEHQHKQKQQRQHRGQDPAVLCSGSARQLSSWMMPFRGTGKRNRDYND
ncbi:uncharacterized protein LOC100840111 [Brachypodium distachyon]|uniref:Uncharacterized protein n=1 Tax=Brachypodium distachyon TaxID=15368 RepID=I1HSY3_BRADI|nr:uncharacterized protein LOC100840111 [Brachypodium distachyon]PNT73124.1 hypothetical protein BRADI_2g53680v3 [Brachypodium distachyon]|eukprot:XP_003567236.1 uncharacterized protein LOC100840111 [Brachypodium distachyon]